MTVVAAALMVAGSLIGFRLDDPSKTQSLAACTFHPKAFIKVDIGGQLVPLTNGIDPDAFALGSWSIKNDRSQITKVEFDQSTGLADPVPAIDKTYCCGDAGFNDASHHPGRTYKVGEDSAAVTLTINDARYSVVKQCPYDSTNPNDPSCVPAGSTPLTISNLPVDCLQYAYGWVLKCQGNGCPTSTTPIAVATPTPTAGQSFNACKIHFIIDNSSSVEVFKVTTKTLVEDVIKKYRTLPGHQNDTVQVNYQFFNKDVNPASPYVSTDVFAFPNPFPQENWTNIYAALQQAVEPSTPTTKIVNILLTDGKPTVLDKTVNGAKEQCVGSYENRTVDGCRPCLRSLGASCPSPHATLIASCPQSVKSVCSGLDYTRDFIQGITQQKWVDYSVAIGNTPDTDLLDKVSKNGVITEDELSTKINQLFERECGIPGPTPGRERSRGTQPSPTSFQGRSPIIDKKMADINNDLVISALDIAACLGQESSLKCDIVTDGKINAQDRSAHIGLLGQKL